MISLPYAEMIREDSVLKIQDMELVTEVIKAGSISAAAKALFVSQPSLSQSNRKAFCQAKGKGCGIDT